MSRAQLRALNEERQKQIVADTEKLLSLAQELKAFQDQPKQEGQPKQNDVASETMKRLNEIEKLAHEVKQKVTD